MQIEEIQSRMRLYGNKGQKSIRLTADELTFLRKNTTLNQWLDESHEAAKLNDPDAVIVVANKLVVLAQTPNDLMPFAIESLAQRLG